MSKSGDKETENEINRFVIQPQNINFVQEMIEKEYISKFSNFDVI